jgi:hypothetical protein
MKAIIQRPQPGAWFVGNSWKYFAIGVSRSPSIGGSVPSMITIRIRLGGSLPFTIIQIGLGIHRKRSESSSSKRT